MPLKLEYSVEKPLNRESEIQDLISSFITTDAAYDRNHGPIPHLSADTHVVQVTGLVRTPLSLSITQLQTDFPQHEITCALQCAGNRRHTMRTCLKEVDGIDWGDAAVMNCNWRGPRLRDVLLRAELRLGENSEHELNGCNGYTNGHSKAPSTGHVAFACFQTECQDSRWYGGSIELERAMRNDADVILALEMNGKPLPPKHGFPVRVVVPGVAGARCVKWLDRITVQLEESQNHYQTYDYKILPPEAVDRVAAKRFWSITPAIQNMPVNSVIARPLAGETVQLEEEGGTVRVEGYALPGGDQGPVVRVEVSVDGGNSWVNAELLEGKGQRWCWVLWRADVRVDKGRGGFVSRATDRGGNVQARCPEWNLRGVCYNGYGESKDVDVV